MRISTNVIPCSVVLFALLVKGTQAIGDFAAMAEAMCSGSCDHCAQMCNGPGQCCTGDCYIGAVGGGCSASDCLNSDCVAADKCVPPTAVTGVTANATDLTMDGFDATVTCAPGYYSSNLGTPTVCSSINASWTYTGSCTGWTNPAATDCADGSFWTTGSTTADSTCVECAAGTFSASNNDACAAWSEPAATDCADGSFWTGGTTSTDSTCVACTDGTFSASDNAACAAWSEPTAADCADGSFWTTGTASTDSTCVECAAGTFSTSNNDACAAWSEPAATDCADGSFWTTGSTTADSTCVECAAGTFSAGNNDACSTHTPCAADTYTAVAGTTTEQPRCTDCTDGTFRTAGSTSALTVEDPGAVCFLCKANYHVVNKVCTACVGGLTNPAGDDASGSNTLCGCAANEYVKDNVCTLCRAGARNDAGDDSTAGDTTCTAVECPVNSNGNDVSDGCKCDPGFSGGVAATSADPFYTSTCTAITCGENERVKGNACVTCPTGTDNAAGDDASKADTMCAGTPTRSYADLGWRGSSCNNPAASTVGGASRLVIGDKKKACYAGKTFKQAETICYEAGARLCTSDEIEAGVTTGTGCNYDSEHVWTSTEGDCDAGQHVTLLGKGGGKCNAGTLDSKKRCDAA